MAWQAQPSSRIPNRAATRVAPGTQQLLTNGPLPAGESVARDLLEEHDIGRIRLPS